MTRDPKDTPIYTMSHWFELLNTRYKIGNTRLVFSYLQFDMNALRLRRWCFTLNNPNEREVTNIKKRLNVNDCIYAIVGQERGAATNTFRLQGFVHFKKQLHFNTLKCTIGESAYIESARGTDVQNKAYCEKDNDILIEIGEPDNKYRQNQTNNYIYEIEQKIANGDSFAMICEDRTH